MRLQRRKLLLKIAINFSFVINRAAVTFVNTRAACAAAMLGFVRFSSRISRWCARPTLQLYCPTLSPIISKYAASTRFSP